MISWMLVALVCVLNPAAPLTTKICEKHIEATFPTAEACKAEMKRFRHLENVELSCEEVKRDN
jgi:hypothetical protein